MTIPIVAGPEVGTFLFPDSNGTFWAITRDGRIGNAIPGSTEVVYETNNCTGQGWVDPLPARMSINANGNGGVYVAIADNALTRVVAPLSYGNFGSPCIAVVGDVRLRSALSTNPLVVAPTSPPFVRPIHPEYVP